MYTRLRGLRRGCVICELVIWFKQTTPGSVKGLWQFFNAPLSPHKHVELLILDLVLLALGIYISVAFVKKWKS